MCTASAWSSLLGGRERGGRCSQAPRASELLRPPSRRSQARTAPGGPGRRSCSHGLGRRHHRELSGGGDEGGGGGTVRATKSRAPCKAHVLTHRGGAMSPTKRNRTAGGSSRTAAPPTLARSAHARGPVCALPGHGARTVTTQPRGLRRGPSLLERRRLQLSGTSGMRLLFQERGPGAICKEGQTSQGGGEQVAGTRKVAQPGRHRGPRPWLRPKQLRVH